MKMEASGALSAGILIGRRSPRKRGPYSTPKHTPVQTFCLLSWWPRTRIETCGQVYPAINPVGNPINCGQSRNQRAPSREQLAGAKFLHTQFAVVKDHITKPRKLRRIALDEADCVKLMRLADHLEFFIWTRHPKNVTGVVSLHLSGWVLASSAIPGRPIASGAQGMSVVPVPRDIQPGSHPDTLIVCDPIQKSGQRCRSAGSPGESAV